MRTCRKSTPATGAAREMTEAVAGVMEAEAEVADSAVNAATVVAVVVFAETGPLARRVVIAEHPTEVLARVGMTAAVLLAGTGEAAEIVADSGDATTATADRVSRLRPRSRD